MCKLIVYLNIALTIFDDDDFHKFFEKYTINNLGYNIPKSNTMRSKIKELSDQEKDFIKSVLKEQIGTNLIVNGSDDKRRKKWSHKVIFDMVKN